MNDDQLVFSIFTGHMSALDEKGIIIPAIFVEGYYGKQIVDAYLYNTGHELLVTSINNLDLR